MVRRRLALLAGAVVAGVVLRVWRIGSKPLWLDEVVTALVCLGRGPESVPVGVAFDLARLPELFSVDTAATWRDLIALLGHPGLQHTHPPIFYILSHQWLAWAQPSLADLASTLRLVAALFGVLAIVATYAAAREAYDDNAGLVAAALTAVSPYTVMLGQEARNYTLPLLLTTCSLWAALAIVRRLHDGGPRAGWWALWVVTAVLGLYSHYYAAFACAAQIPVLALACVRARARSDIVALLGAMAVTAIAFLPWLPIALAHAASPEQHWMLLRSRLHALMIGYETVSAWQTMILGERWGVPVWSARIGSQVFALVFGVWVLALVIVMVWRERCAATLPVIIALTLAEIIAAVVVLGKDLLSEVRYHFVYYPPAVALLAGVITRLPARSQEAWHFNTKDTKDTKVRPQILCVLGVLCVPRAVAIAALIAVGAINALLVDVGIEDWKPPPPDRIAHLLAGSLEPPAVIVSGVGNFHEIATELSYYVELWKRAPVRTTSVVFVRRGEGYVFYAEPSDPTYFWRGFGAIRGVIEPTRTLWVHDTGMRVSDYPRQVTIGTERGIRVVCGIQERPPALISDEDRPLRSPSYRRYHCAAIAAAIAERGPGR